MSQDQIRQEKEKEKIFNKKILCALVLAVFQRELFIDMMI